MSAAKTQNNEQPPKVMIITGASRGIGAELARLAAHQGYRVCVNFNASAGAAEQVVEDIIAGGGQAMSVQADISKKPQVNHLFDECLDAYGQLDVLVNNAGTSYGREDFINTDWQRSQDLFATNVFGTFMCSAEALRRMTGKGGAIVNVSSQAGVFGGNRLTTYAASKGAVEAFTKGLAREAATHDVRVNAVRPGLIDTGQFDGLSADQRQQLVASVPLGRMGQASEVAAVILWLASDQASYVTGTIVDVHGAR